jgi:hypothetical protein
MPALDADVAFSGNTILFVFRQNKFCSPGLIPAFLSCFRFLLLWHGPCFKALSLNNPVFEGANHGKDRQCRMDEVTDFK